MTFPKLPQNWPTILGGLLASIPTAIVGSGIMLSPQWQHILALIGAFGLMLTGGTAKAFNTHSTAEQVQTSTVETAIAAGKPIPPPPLTR
jgi:hypothetical protein